MSDHKFEKQVRQKLGHLKLTPSAEAWEQIEERLRKERRKTPLLWVPLLVAAVISAGLLVRHDLARPGHPTLAQASPGQTFDAPQPSTQNHSAATPGVASHFNPSAIENNATQKPLSSNQVTPLTEGKSLTDEGTRATGNLRPVTGNIERNPSNVATHQKQPENVLAPSGATPRGVILGRAGKGHSTVKAHAAGESNGADQDKVAATVSSTLAKTSGVSQSTVKPDIAPGLANEHGYSKNLPRARYPLSAFVSPSKTIRSEPPVSAATFTGFNEKVKPKKVIRKRWSFGVDVYGGMVAVNEGGLLSVDKPKVEDVAFSSVASSQLSAFYRPVSKPSTITPGPAFSAGAFARRAVSPRLSLTAGASYLQLNTHTSVGYRVNDNQIVNNGRAGYLSVQSYYMVDQSEQKEYRNRYHFLSFPLSLNWRFNNSPRLPISLNGGVVVSRLLSSTSLHFDGTTGVYYKNDRLLNQTQAGLIAGLSFSLLNRTHHPIEIGPSVFSNLSSILKKDISSTNHFTSFGLDVKYLVK